MLILYIISLENFLKIENENTQQTRDIEPMLVQCLVITGYTIKCWYHYNTVFLYINNELDSGIQGLILSL